MTAETDKAALRERRDEVTVEMIAAAWEVVRGRYPNGRVLGPGPGFREAITAALKARPHGIAGPLAAPPARAENADRLAAELAAAEEANEALDAKLHTLAPHGSCACSYDRPGDVCAHHSPALIAAKAEIVRLSAENAALRAGQDEALRKAIRKWSAKLHVPVTRMMSRVLREEFAAAHHTDGGRRCVG